MTTLNTFTPERLSTTPCRRGWKRPASYSTGVLLALSGLILGAAAAANYALRAAGGQVPAEPAFATVLRVAGCGVLVIAGFTLMVLSVRGVDAAGQDGADVRTDIVSASAGEELLCHACGAANDHLARFCDQCGKRL
jgi:hypothetical protein